MMKIYDPNKRREINIEEDGIRIFTHEIPGKGSKEEMEKVKCIEFTVIGNNGKWRSWLPYDDFAAANPTIKESDLNIN